MSSNLIKATALSLLLATPAFADHKEDVSHDMASVGSLMISGPAIRATPPAAPAAGGYITVMNMGADADTLVAASVASEMAGMVQLHTMVMDGDVMRMSEVEGGIGIPAGETVQLMPGGLHIMFMNLAEGLEAGTSHDVTLTFENAGDVTMTFPVLSMKEVMELTGAKPMSHKGHDHHDDHDDHDHH